MRLFHLLWAAALAGAMGQSNGDQLINSYDGIPIEFIHKLSLPDPFDLVTLRLVMVASAHPETEIGAVDIQYGATRLSVDPRLLRGIRYQKPTVSFRESDLDGSSGLDRFDIIFPYGDTVKLEMGLPIDGEWDASYILARRWVAFTVSKEGDLGEIRVNPATLTGWREHVERPMRVEDVPFFIPENSLAANFDAHDAFPGFRVVDPFACALKSKLPQPFGTVTVRTVHARDDPEGKLQALEVKFEGQDTFLIDAGHLDIWNYRDCPSVLYEPADLDESGALSEFGLVFYYGAPMKYSFDKTVDIAWRSIEFTIDAERNVIAVEDDLSMLCYPGGDADCAPLPVRGNP